MQTTMKRSTKLSLSVISTALLAAAFGTGASASDNAQGPNRTVEGISAEDSTSFTVDFDKTYPAGINIDRMIEVEVELEDGTVVEPELTDYHVSGSDRSQVIVEHADDDLDGLSGTLSVNDVTIDFSYADEPVTIDIFHTNDIHSKIDNLGLISHFINEQGEAADNHLYLDAGDIFSGNAVVDLQEGAPIIDILNEMNLDAMAIGNHEFDYGQQAFADRVAESEFDWLSANTEIVDPDVPIEQPKPYEIYEVDGVEVGVFALTQNPPSTRPSGIEGIDFHDYVETAEQYAYLEEETDVLIALTHIGHSADIALAEEVDFFDVIIGGHSHTRTFEEVVVNDTPVVQAGADSLFVGHFNLEYDNGDVSFNDFYLQDVDELSETNESVQELIDMYNEDAEELLSEVVGETNTGLYREARYERDTSLGNFWTDAMKEALDADMAVTNNGGIRASIEPGDITAGDIYVIEPFANELSEIEISGAEMQNVIEGSLRSDGGIDLQTSGLTYTLYVNDEDEVVDADLYVDGEPIDPDETYTLATNNFMAEGGSGYDFSNADIIQPEAGYVTMAMFQHLDFLMDTEGAVDYEDGEGRISIEQAD
ncbi:bifunctional metallophosphatase/5'-nucleotidase [Alkalicoccus luteus]|uniref:bifunctional metallophosphatase/5'-nucleotidase n=1 Tax=Alkalicoccus luteus TaxID=1237094 RepID=UPI00403495E7